MTITDSRLSVKGKEDALRCPDCGRLIAEHFEGFIRTQCPRCKSKVEATRTASQRDISGTGRQKGLLVER